MKILNIKAIRTDGGTQSRAEINSDAVNEYAEAIKGGATFPAVTVFHDGADYWLADGFHRFHATKQAGKTSIEAEVLQGTVRDAISHSLSANDDHGLRRTNADKRKAVETALADLVWSTWSDRKIADLCKVGHPMVAAIRNPKVAEKQKENRQASAAKNTKPVESDSTPPATTTAPKPAPKLEATPPAIEDNGMLTSDELVAEMQETQAENEQLQERVALMAKDDKAAEIDKLLTRINGLEGRLHQAMNQIKASEDTTKVHAALIHKLRKLLGVEGHKAIYAAVAALVSERAEA